MHDNNDEKRFWQGIGTVVIMYLVLFTAAYFIWG